MPQHIYLANPNQTPITEQDRLIQEAETNGWEYYFESKEVLGCQERVLIIVEPEKEFNDSVEATEFVLDLINKINDPRLKEWVEVTDTNFGSEADLILQRVQLAVENLWIELNEAGQ